MARRAAKRMQLGRTGLGDQYDQRARWAEFVDRQFAGRLVYAVGAFEAGERRASYSIAVGPYPRR